MWKFIMVRLWIKFLILAKITTEEKRIHIIESWAKTVNGWSWVYNESGQKPMQDEYVDALKGKTDLNEKII